MTGRTRSSTSLVLRNAAVVEVTEASPQKHVSCAEVFFCQAVCKKGAGSCVNTFRWAQHKCRKGNKELADDAKNRRHEHVSSVSLSSLRHLHCRSTGRKKGKCWLDGLESVHLRLSQAGLRCLCTVYATMRCKRYNDVQDVKGMQGPSHSHCFRLNVNLCTFADSKRTDTDKQCWRQLQTETYFWTDFTISYLNFST